ncbi:glycosyltransferase [Microbacterium indicum]|uniref:glycosyltransferase n=1 Tax=Microbacterium indicum TaxID=358100 RepID=UPI0003FF045F|nr:glycosyltransferase family 2 protein [Microbacterium indicum]
MTRPGQHADAQPIVFRNHWRDVFDGTVPDDWEPTLSVSVIIPAYKSKTLEFTLASLAAQDYPEHLLEVVVLDDGGGEEPVEIGEYAHPNTRLIRVHEVSDGWGRSNATDIGIKATTGDIIYWVDSDMILFRDNVRQHAKWAHFIPEAATIGDKGFIETWDYTPEQVFEKVRDDSIRDDYDPAELYEHWSMEIYRSTDELNDSNGRNYSTHMGATATVTREVYDRTFGQDTRLHLGEDTEIAYQLWQAGAVFIPVHEALAWHMGPGTVQHQGEKVAWHNNVHFAQRMPIPRYRRTADNRIWEVPLLTVVTEVTAETAKWARPAIDRILNNTQTDVHVVLVGPWSELHEGRRRMLADPLNELYLVREWFRTDNRVKFVEERPETVFPSPFRIDMPITVALESTSLQAMYRKIDQEQHGAVRYFTPGHGNDEAVTIWNSYAVARATKYVTGERTLIDAVADVSGFEWAAGDEAKISDLRDHDDLDQRIVRVDPIVARLEKDLWRMTKRAEAAEAEAADLRGVTLTRQIARRANGATGGAAGRVARKANDALGGLPSRAARRIRRGLSR